MYTSLYELNNVNDDKWNRFHFLFLNCCLLCSSPRPNICKIKKLQDRLKTTFKKPHESCMAFFGKKPNLLNLLQTPYNLVLMNNRDTGLYSNTNQYRRLCDNHVYSIPDVYNWEYLYNCISKHMNILIWLLYKFLPQFFKTFLYIFFDFYGFSRWFFSNTYLLSL